MRFFERQRNARSQTKWLLLMFGLLVVLLVVAVNVGLSFALKLSFFGLSSGDGNPAYFHSVNTFLVLLFVLGGWWMETSVLEGGGEALARQAGAREARPRLQEAEQQFCNIVSELAIAARMKPPKAMVLPRHDDINAFAAGWEEEDGVVVVTQGALERLTRDELQGLLAHEFSHLREGDTRLNMRLVGMVFGLELIYNLGVSMCEYDEDENGKAETSGALSWLAIPGFCIKGLGFIGWLAGRMLKAGVSRQREYLADASAVQFTRSKEGLGGVLRKVDAESKAGRFQRSGSLNMHPAVEHMLLVSASTKRRWFASHPPLAERIRRIYGRPMAPLPNDEAVAQPNALF